MVFWVEIRLLVGFFIYVCLFMFGYIRLGGVRCVRGLLYGVGVYLGLVLGY